MARILRISPIALLFLGILAAGCNVTEIPNTPTSLGVTSVVPNKGAFEGGTAVVIIGTGFETPVTVYFGSVRVNVASATARTINLITPASSETLVDIRVVNADGEEARLANAYTYTGFTITGVSQPAAMPFELIKILGIAIPQGTRVSIGGVEASTYLTAQTEIRVGVPALPPGPVDVTITPPTGESVTLTDKFAISLVSVTANPKTPAPGARFAVSFSGGRPNNFFDEPWEWIGLFRVGASNDQAIWSQDVFGPDGTFQLNAPTQPGDYEFRVIVYGSPHVAGRSEAFTIG